MPDMTQPARPIAAGFADEIKVTVITDGEAAVFPDGCGLRAEFREIAGGDVLAAIATGEGKIVRLDGDTIMLRLAATDTARFPAGFVWVDFIRTDLVPERWVDVQLRLPVVLPITRPRA